MTMHSWVFRNRSRLRWIYGPAPQEARHGTVPVPAAVPQPLSPQAGRVEREPADAVLHPMPRRAS